MRFHLVSVPYTNTTEGFSVCPYTEKVRKFARMMMGLGHEVFLYAGEFNDTPCTEHITCITEAERLVHIGTQHYSKEDWNSTKPTWVSFNNNAITEIMKRQQQKDFICVISGWANKSINDALPHLTFVEFGSGYAGVFSRFIVFESYAWMHLLYGCREPNHNAAAIDGQFFHAVIPGYLDINTFPFSAEKDDYFLYLGRLTDRKGYKIAIDVCKRLGKKLILAGVLLDPTPPEYGEYIGPVGPMQRGELMSRAKAVFVPSLYIEPFANVNIEAQACGTPVICTDWGAMTETVIEGKTGYRCRTLQEFMDAATDVERLDPYVIRRHVEDNYSLEATAPKYDKYFRRLLQLWGEGWYEMRPEPARLPGGVK